MAKKTIEHVGQPAKKDYKKGEIMYIDADSYHGRKITNKKLERLQIRANSLYWGLINAIQTINNTTTRFYEKSSKYAKLLKEIEEEIKK